MITTTNQYADAKKPKCASTRMQVLIAQLAVATITPKIGATATAAMMTVVTIGTVAVIGQKDPSLVNIATAN